MVRTIGRVIVFVVLLTALVYFCDDLSVRFRIPNNRNPFETVKVQPYYAVPRKDGKTEFMLLDAQDETCIVSLFPHMGYPPCWYLKRQAKRRINL